jgi:hypothetical protein
MPGVQEKDLSDWGAFECELLELRQEFGRSPSELLFRGQNDSKYLLTTTLERAGCERMRLKDYYQLVASQIRPAVETFTGVIWDVPQYSVELETSFYDRELFSLRKFPSVELYRYMVYLRHHGFPSPLLDWSYSPYVAAFFAFRDQTAEPNKRSIYVYCEAPKGFKGGAVGEPAMRPIGPYVRSHRRHFRQQSNYTICCAFGSDLGWYFYPHDPVFGSRDKQDFLWKFNLPSTERTKVLRLLNDYNLNAFSLFDSEEALLETMWLRERDLKVPDSL